MLDAARARDTSAGSVRGPERLRPGESAANKKGAGTDCSGAFVVSSGTCAALLLYDVSGLESLGPFRDIEFDRIAFRKGLETLSLDRGVVDEDVVATIMLDKPVALVVVKPLYFTDCQYCSPPFGHV